MSLIESVGIDKNNWTEIVKLLLNQPLTKKILTSTFKSIKDSEKKTNDFLKYKENLITTYSTSKSLLFKNEPRLFYENYIDLDLEYTRITPIKNNKQSISTKKSSDIFNISDKILIVGTAGSGKTTLIKHLFMSSMSENPVLPIFFELKNMNNNDTDILNQSILRNMKDNGLELSISELNHLFDDEHTIIFLDGCDEVEPSKRKNLIKEVNRISNHKCKLVITSRPSSASFTIFDKLTELHVKPLSYEQSEKLVRNFCDGGSICDKGSISEFAIQNFIDDLKKNHSIRDSFMLSNPLMVTILMLAYTLESSIPEKSYIIYENAYKALYSNHDSLKNLFTRKQYSNIGSSEFLQILRFLSAKCYLDNSEGFENKKKFKETLNSIQKISGISFNKDNFINDLIESVCIILKEGEFYEYVHKSFLEFFTAEFILKESILKDSDRKNIIEQLDILNENRVFEFLFEMDRNKLINLFIQPFLNNIKSSYSTNGTLREIKKNFFQDHILEFTIIFPETKTYEDFNGFVFEESFGHSFATTDKFRIIEYIYDIFVKYKVIKDIRKDNDYESQKKLIQSILNKWNSDTQPEIKCIKKAFNNNKELIFNIDKIFDNEELYRTFEQLLNTQYDMYLELLKFIEKNNKKTEERRNDLFSILNTGND